MIVRYVDEATSNDGYAAVRRTYSGTLIQLPEGLSASSDKAHQQCMAAIRKQMTMAEVAQENVRVNFDELSARPTPSDTVYLRGVECKVNKEGVVVIPRIQARPPLQVELPARVIRAVLKLHVFAESLDHPDTEIGVQRAGGLLTDLALNQPLTLLRMVEEDARDSLCDIAEFMVRAARARDLLEQARAGDSPAGDADVRSKPTPDNGGGKVIDFRLSARVDEDSHGEDGERDDIGRGHGMPEHDEGGEEGEGEDSPGEDGSELDESLGGMGHGGLEGDDGDGEEEDDGDGGAA